jgi:hypothetical protein
MDNEKVFYDFLTLLGKFFREEKNIGFYATRLGVTQHMLMSVIKNFKGKNFENWLELFEINDKNIL